MDSIYFYPEPDHDSLRILRENQLEVVRERQVRAALPVAEGKVHDAKGKVHPNDRGAHRNHIVALDREETRFAFAFSQPNRWQEQVAE
jgi:hypothetical protein